MDAHTTINGVTFRTIAPNTEFVPIADYSMYAISTVRPYNVKNINTNRVLTPYFDKSVGYVRLQLKHNDGKKHNVRLHKLICDTLMPIVDREVLNQVDHIDRNTTNNVVSNLRAVTPTTNQHNKSTTVNNVYHETDVTYDDNAIQQQLTKITHINNDEQADNYYLNTVNNCIYVGKGNNVFRLCDEFQ